MLQKHIPVLLNEVLNGLQLKADGTYVDLTLGRGGHASAILKQIPDGKLVAFDKDVTAIKESGPRLSQIGDNFQLVHSDFKNFKTELGKLGITKADGILADLGVSSPQLDNAHRGFSYSKDAPLDMRMDESQTLSADTIINTYSADEIANILWNYADVKLARRVAKGIVSKRPIKSTMELVDVLRSALPAAVVRKKNPAKAVFQALRIAVNDELNALKQLLADALSLLEVGGTLAIITFHSIEDRMVKKAYGSLIADNTGKLPIMVEKKWKVKKMDPSASEIETNNRSRTARLRLLTKLKD